MTLTFDCVNSDGVFDTGNDGLNGGALLGDQFGFFIPGSIRNTFMTQVDVVGRYIPGLSLVWESPSDLYDLTTNH